MNLRRQPILQLIACVVLPFLTYGDLVPGDFGVVRVAQDEIFLIALKAIPKGEEIRVTDSFWINGAFDDSGNVGVFEIDRKLAPGEQYRLQLERFGIQLDWDKTLHLYQISTTLGTARLRHLFMIEANRAGLRWFPSPPGLRQDFSHIIIREIEAYPGTINHIFNEKLQEKSLNPYQWLRALGSFRAWIHAKDFSSQPVSEFIKYRFDVSPSPGIISFAADSYHLDEQSGMIRVPVRRQYGCTGSAHVAVETCDRIAPLDSWENMGPDDYYPDLTGVAYSPELKYAVAVSPDSGQLLLGDASGWTRRNTNDQSGQNLGLSSIAHDGAHFWACSLDGRIYRSEDGIKWDETYDPGNEGTPLFRIIYLEEAAIAKKPALIALGAAGRVVYYDPSDGWLISPNERPGRLFSVASDGLDYVAVGENGTILVSNNLKQTWQPLPGPQALDLYAITFASLPSNSGFFAVGEDGVILYSVDPGDGFNRIGSGTRQSLFDISTQMIEMEPGSGKMADVLIACGAGGTVTASKDGAPFESRRRIDRASALYASVGIKDKDHTTRAFIGVGEYGARVSLNLNGIQLTGVPKNIQLNNSASTNVFWDNGENGEKLVTVKASTVDLFRQRIDLCLKRPASGGGNYRIDRRTTEINLMDSTGEKVFITPNFGPLLYITDHRLEINPDEEWELKFRIGNGSNRPSSRLFLRFDGTNLPDWEIPRSLLPGSGNGIAPLSVSNTITRTVRQPVESVSLYEEFGRDQPVLKYRQIINSLWVSPTWSPNTIYPRSLGIYLEDGGNLPDPGIPGIGDFN